MAKRSNRHLGSHSLSLIEKDTSTPSAALSMDCGPLDHFSERTFEVVTGFRGGCIWVEPRVQPPCAVDREYAITASYCFFSVA